MTPRDSAVLRFLATATCLIGLSACSRCGDDGSSSVGASKGSEEAATAYDVLLLSDDHVVLATRQGPLLSKDGGKTWKPTARTAFFMHEMTLGSAGRLWGLGGRYGIHEASSGTIGHSDDGGESWSRVYQESPKFVPATFSSSHGSTPVILEKGGQLWEHRPEPRESFESWTPLGNPNPDKEGIRGIVTEKAIYVTSSSNLWMSLDGAKTWEGHPSNHAQVFRSGGFCWSVDIGGEVHRSPLGSMTWERMGGIRGLQTAPARIAVWNDRVFVAGLGNGMQPFGAVLNPGGESREFPGVRGRQCYSVRLGQDGRAWFAAQGLFREGEDGDCRRIWP